MAYNEQLAARIRTALANEKDVEEQLKFGGISFNVNGKMCVRATNDEIMLRCEPEKTDEYLAEKGVRRFEMKGKPMMQGWLLLSPEATKSEQDFNRWMGIALAYNKHAKAAKKKK